MRLNVVEWLHENRKEGCTQSAMNWAAMNGHLDVVKWLYKNQTKRCTTWAMDWAMYWATRNGHLDIVQWIHENRIEEYDDSQNANRNVTQIENPQIHKKHRLNWCFWRKFQKELK